jgi:glycosyltransferase involved in cell wall biosynthesis
VRPVTEAPDEYLARLGLRHDRLIVGVVALLEWRKGHLILLQAMNSIRQQFGADAVPILLIEGDGPMSKRLRRYVRDTDLDAYVRFIGREAKVFNLLNTVDIVVLPSLCQEDFPNVTLEAMSLGKPVIGTRLSGIPEQIDDGVTGLIVTPGDVAELAAAIYKLMSTPELRHSMADAARQRFNHAYSAPIAVRRYKDLYRLLLKTTCA